MCLSYLLKETRQEGSKQYSNFGILVLFTFFMGFISFGQVEYELRTEVDDAKLALWAAEVYQDCPQYASSEHLDIYRKQIDKIVISEVLNIEEYNELTDLSTVGLKNKCNYSLPLDTSLNFSLLNFNPLKYFFDFYAPEDKMYHVSGTNFIITINK